MDQPFEALLRLDMTRMKRAAAKLTHVGEQTGPVLSIVISSFYYLARLDLFRDFQNPRANHANDEMLIIGNFSVAPADFFKLIGAAYTLCSRSEPTPASPSLSITAVVDAPEGRVGDGFLLSDQGGVVLHREFAAALDPSNGIGQTVLRLQREAAYRGPA